MRVPLLIVALALAGCAHGPAPQPASPVDFPLYRDSSVLVVRDWHHTLSPGERSALGIIGSGNEAYAGHEVVTATGSSFGEVAGWLRELDAHPPNGYHVTVWGSGVDEARERARNMGVDFGVFDRSESGVTHDVLVVTVDPDILQQKAGIMLSLISRFHDLPPFLRAPIDAQARAQTGFSVSDATDPTTPIGAAVDALGRLHDVHSRGVILIDARPADAR
ncbi:MAG TPA: hypothetical protein VIN40_01280 [Candidatus Tyrphobacter sp.]